jgi:uncharacterized protein YjlB
VQFGGKQGRKITIKRGDVLILPSGTGHECLWASDDFLVVGAYPATGTYDVFRTSPEERTKALKTVPNVPPPRRDPIYGRGGPLLMHWKRAARRRRAHKA